MSQNAPRPGLPSSSDAYSNLDIDADTYAVSGIHWDSRRSYASSSSPRSQTSHRDKPSSPTTGRLINVPSLSSVGSLPHPGQRSPRPPVPSPLSTASNVATSPSSTTVSEPAGFATQQGYRPIGYTSTENPTSKVPVGGQTTFYSDSSNPSSPEEEISRLNFPSQPNDARSVSSVSKPVGSTAALGSSKATRSTMAATMASNPNEVTKAMPRNNSIDTAVSVLSSKSGSSSKGATHDAQSSTDIASLIQTAGSPESVIEHLLKEKHSQSQQNSQLWRLVDKQRAMILGLNKDLEAAIKEKEKYRRKLKEIISNPAVIKAASGSQGESSKGSTDRRARSPRIEVPESKAQAAAQALDSPSLDSDSQKNSPVDILIAPYPITPPADRPHVSPNAVSEMLDPKHIMPKPREHALDKYDHEADEKAADKAFKNKSDQQLREIPYNISLPPSRSLPSEPPKVPPPKVPTAPPSSSVSEPSPQPDKGLGQFPSPPRKAPPAPLQLKQQVRRHMAVSAEEDDSDSDYDDILEVNEIVDENRGRRKTRDDDDREREVAAFREAQNRNVTKMEPESRVRSATHKSGISALPRDLDPEKIMSVEDFLLNERSNNFGPPLLSPGLPSTPRPFGAVQHSASAPLSARLGPAAPLSPRPPRQPIVLPPNTPLVSSPPSGSARSSPIEPLNDGKRGGDANLPSPTERTKIYKGLVTDEYPDLLLAPNALPSIEIKVASSRMKPSRASLMSLTQLEEDPVFTLAVLSRADHGELWRVEKDIVSLGKLDARLKQCTAFTAKTPERSLFSGHAPAKLDARRIALEQYMDELLDTPFDTATAVELCKYLSTHTLPPNADETGSSFRPTPENNGLKLGADGRPVRSGYLTKKGKNFGGWKARFFALEGPQLKYYETPGGAHLGTIKLQGAQIGKQSQSQSNDNQSPARPTTGEELDNQYRHAFLILEPKKKDSNALVKHVLCAESDRERDLWVDVLLQWIDYRGPDDVEPLQNVKITHDRQVPGTDHPSSSRSKKSSNSKPQHQHTDSDTIIGVRYDSTHAGEAPQKGAAALSELPSSHNLVNETMSSQANKLISAPKDPQIISDSAAWGNKSGLTIPTHDEKKQRKRSFFGFGPKTRSSSDGQDSLFGGSDAGSTNGPSHSHSHQGPVRQVFGAPLAEAVRYNPPVDVDVPLPSVVFRCIQYLDHKNAIVEEGIFRLSGSNVVIKQLRERFNVESDINLVTDEQYYDIHAVASLLKLYLRELPTTILTRDLHLDFLSTTEIQDRQEKVAKLSELAQRLPQANATLLKYLIAFLIRIINNADSNKMNVRNVGIVFSPTLNIPAQVFAMFLQNYEGIFGIDPNEYELLSPNGESDSHGHTDVPQRFEPPPRPSTSSGSASPHRQPRMENMREHSRSTPTPPLISTVQGARSTPTPPLGGRPAYESGYSIPTGHDGHNYHPSQRAAPGYDRPIYQSSSENYGASEQQLNMHKKRRESSMYVGGMMNLQHQGSKSRLREESRLI
ncbi:Rho GTPase activating protein [Conoideocrella luteorostrata]|uniref:Rho GTPase activating protein n=1 Tax=Conoideocrella luteorostrata TaxID=1105319 RepID=A0AAJ0CDH2_9HYPO|nr:Rho GTPase activating protein [Conoideocrella luteorostrata]